MGLWASPLQSSAWEGTAPPSPSRWARLYRHLAAAVNIAVYPGEGFRGLNYVEFKGGALFSPVPRKGKPQS